MTNPIQRDQYQTFMREYEALGHMSKVKGDAPNEGYYMPHHAVRKEDSLTTTSSVRRIGKNIDRTVTQ